MSFNVADIIEAWTKEEPIHEKWFQKRLEICATCPLNSINKEEKTFLEKTREALGGIFKEAYCTACGCTITKKASLKKSACGLDDIGKTPLWFPLEFDALPNHDLVKVIQTDGQDYNIQRTDVVEIDLGQTEEDLITFFVDIKHDKPLSFLRVNGTCSCTATTSEVIGGNTNRIQVKISTKGLQEDIITKKTIKVVFMNTKTNYEQIYPIRCLSEKKSRTIPS